MTQINKEKLINKYPLPVTIDETELILKQMKNSICQIKNRNGNGTGFFCKISNKKLLITNEHVINEEIIKFNNIINVKLNDNRIRKDIKIVDYYISKEYDTTIIEIKGNDENINYLELDTEIFDENVNIYNESIYIIQYPRYGNDQKGAVSYGILSEIQNNYNIIHYCSTDHGSSGSPILKLSNKKVIGIHKEGSFKYNFNRGTFLKYPIYEYLKRKNEVKLKVKIEKEKEDINKDIYFLDIKIDHYEDIEIIETIKDNIYSCVDKGKYKDNFVAIKKIKKDKLKEDIKLDKCIVEVTEKDFQEEIIKFNKELSIMKKCYCENSVELYGYFDTKEYFIIVMELCDSTLFKEVVKRKNGFDAKEIREILLQLNNVFRIMNENNIAHRDIKLNNILVKYLNKEKSKFKVLLSDYGVSNQLNSITKKFTTHAGTPIIMAPEILSGKEYNNKCDLWSLGVIIYQLYTKRLPYPNFGSAGFSIFLRINKLDQSVLDVIKDKKLKDLLSKLLVKDPENRISWEEYFEHNFFK